MPVRIASLFAVFGLFVAGCAASGNVAAPSSATAAVPVEDVDESACGDLVIDDSANAIFDSNVIIVGELHGTQEGPEAVGRLICHALDEGKTVAALFEFPDNYSLDPASSDASRDNIVDTICAQMQPYFFNSRDGRGSEAVMALLADLLERKIDAGQLAVAGFDMSADASHPEDMGPSVARHWVMANVIAQYTNSYDLVIVNVGNAHPIVLRSRLIGLHNLSRGSVVAIREIHDTGQAWNCGPDGCGLRNTPRSSVYPKGVPEEFPYMSLSGDIGAFDGYLSLGTITASEPVYQSGDCNRVWRRGL